MNEASAIASNKVGTDTVRSTAGGGKPTNARLLKALRLERADTTPVWFMRQAGRSLPEYRAIKEKYTLLEICRRPELCAEVTLQPVRSLGVDGAVLYADIMHPLIGIGIDLEIVENVGPVVAHPIRDAAGIRRLRPLEPDDVAFVRDGIRCTLSALAAQVPLIGFAGAPFTLASYLVEGRPSRDFLETKRLMYRDPELWHDLMSRLAGIVTAYARMQAQAGVHAIQIFDSWVGALSVDDYRRYVLPYSLSIFRNLEVTGLPLIHFGAGASSLLEVMREAGGSTLGLDWRIPIDSAWNRIGYDRGIQGNLDPLVLLGPWDVVRRETLSILDRAAGRPGHIFNTGHGIHPQTSPDMLRRVVALVHEHGST
ncbi:MAG: uroporphyrinogen decarboxylase [Chloroflexota bacterium]